jgi:ribokinase
VSFQKLNVAVVGHVEWVQFARVGEVPLAGEIAHAHNEFTDPAGGGAVAAVQMARLAGKATLFTALGQDELGRLSHQRLEQLGLTVHSAWRSAPTRRAVSLVDSHGERTITTFGDRLEPLADDRELPWEDLAEMDAVYFTAGDEGALEACRAASVLVATPRARDALTDSAVALDALVLSKDDADERNDARSARAHAKLEVITDGARGGRYRTQDDRTGHWAPVEPPGPAVDSYGCGDSFAAGLTCGLGAALEIEEALDLAARCGAVCLTGYGPYERQLAASAVREP